MRLFAPIAIAASLAIGIPTSASASADDATPFPVCRDVYVNKQWVGAVCADPAHRCLVYGGGTMWNMCFVNPL